MKDERPLLLCVSRLPDYSYVSQTIGPNLAAWGGGAKPETRSHCLVAGEILKGQSLPLIVDRG